MLLFIIIFFAMLIVVGVTMIVGFPVFFKSRRKSLDSKNQIQFAAAPPYRSLFAPDEDETRRIERENLARARDETIEAEEKRLLEKAEIAAALKKIWLETPDKTNTAQLLFSAAESETAKIFSETAESVIQVWRENRIENLSRPDLAALLDSHLKILPQQERTSGALFWLKQEIKILREESE